MLRQVSRNKVTASWRAANASWGVSPKLETFNSLTLSLTALMLLAWGTGAAKTDNNEWGKERMKQ